MYRIDYIGDFKLQHKFERYRSRKKEIVQVYW